MKLSLKVEYACQVLAQLGYTYGRPELPHIEELARAEAVPSNYLVQILNELRTAGLIRSRRGKQGGYALLREPESITLREVVEAVEGEVLAHRSSGSGASSEKAVRVWDEISSRFEGLLEEYTVRHFMNIPVRDMWYI